MYWKLLLVVCSFVCQSSLVLGQDTTVYIPTVPCEGPDCFVTTPTSSTDSTTPGSTTTSLPISYKRTVVFIKRSTSTGQYVYLRGGQDEHGRPECTSNAETSPCSLSIQVKSLGNDTLYARYNAWAVGDTKLDWHGAQLNQGTYNTIAASGTPMAWTTNDNLNEFYQPLNKYGPDYWMSDFYMNCDETKSGWFDVKSFLPGDGNGWESDFIRQGTCSGTGVTSQTPCYDDYNHIGRCGYVNVFIASSPSCVIDAFPL